MSPATPPELKLGSVVFFVSRSHGYSQKGLIKRLTLFVDGDHGGSILRVDVEQDWGPHQVLGQVTQQRHSSEKSDK